MGLVWAWYGLGMGSVCARYVLGMCSLWAQYGLGMGFILISPDELLFIRELRSHYRTARAFGECFCFDDLV